MNSLTALIKASVSSWLLASIAINAIFLSGSQFWSAGIPITVILLSLYTGIAMFPGFILLAISRTLFSPSSHFWNPWICSIVGFLIGILLILIWWDTLTRQFDHLPPIFEASTLAFAGTAGVSGALAFLISGLLLRKIQTEQDAAANP